MDALKIYDRATIDALPWPATPDGAYARRVLEPLVRHGPQHFIDNVQAEMRVLLVGNTVLPLVIADGMARHNTYVCSPTSHYIRYALREVELELSNRPLLALAAKTLLRGFRPLLHWSRVERVVYVNNWLLSTNLYPPLSAVMLAAIQHALADAFPQHALVFRPVNDGLNGALRDQLQRLGCRAVFSRQVYLLDPRDTSYTRKTSYRKDLSLAKRTPYRWVDREQQLTNHAERMHALYTDLYIRKYSPLNPQFNQRFMHAVIEHGWLQPFALQCDDRIDGVLSFVERHGVMTAPLVGYDRNLPAETGLYRLISLKLIEEARERDVILNQSSGAAAFKRHRGAVPSMEYNLVYDQHLPPRMRLPWQVLELLTRHAIGPLMQRYEL